MPNMPKFLGRANTFIFHCIAALRVVACALSQSKNDVSEKENKRPSGCTITHWLSPNLSLDMVVVVVNAKPQHMARTRLGMQQD